MERKFKPTTYRHFKGKFYNTLGLAEHTETGEQFVIYYRTEDGPSKLYARPLGMFMSEVDHEKYPEVEQKYRVEECMGV